jgi:hypothetical protein
LRGSRCGAAILVAALVMLDVCAARAQTSILERQEAMFRRNVGTPEQQRAQFPPHKIVGNLYYVGTQSLASFLVATPEGHILSTTWTMTAVPRRARRAAA